MKLHSIPKSSPGILRMLSLAAMLCGALSGASAAAETTKPAAATASQATTAVSPEERARQIDWRNAMAQVPQPKKGCFKAEYPSREWQEITCTETPNYPQPPRRGPHPLTVGNSNDVAAQAPSGFISTAIGSFDNVTNVTSESGPIGNSGPSIANAYTLQLNTNFFPSSVSCTGSPNPNCQGWQQFVFENNGSIARGYIQYWLIKYNKTCPSGASWNQFSFTGDTDIYCWKNNSLGAVPVPLQPVTNLAQLSLTGNVGAGGDSINVTVGGTIYSRTGDNAVNAASGWQTAEFNIFGDGGNSAGGGQASFNSGASLTPRVQVIYGGNASPTCVAQGFTAETNNLNFGPTAPSAPPPGPALLFVESTAGGAASNCAAAAGVGDTHLTTFSGLLYDFQASGDFVLADSGPDFIVQNRQVSGAPTWPNAAVNSAVAARLGKTTVAICAKPQRLVVDGKPVSLRGGALQLADGADVTRTGNVYVIRNARGDSVVATLNPPNYIDVKVGLGQWPEKVEGLLANPKNDVNLLATREGRILKTPFSFEDIYHPYAESWRVDPKDSLLSVCGREIKTGIPGKPFYAKDLKRDQLKRAEAICAKAGVEKGPLQDACILDVAVIGKAGAAKIHAKTPAPNAVGIIQ
ncbi:VWD domain-containing protein [Mesorhizobium sp. B2-4-6]|uniref:VWD domain-containing protein n=1 Tax=Mesorhizobium sp. B2-4-6 TaxID=2589943 RepID=UPI00112D11DC|nr:VWD domain-containing protein [Mesorhizobium sp. B2-4-6]TPL49566.1 hypothetical protein FJ957_10815 [Mesorhizobium sp. B2-4-6]